MPDYVITSNIAFCVLNNPDSFVSYCRCDTGYGGITCLPETQLPNSLKTDFSMMHKLESDWSAVLGADVAGANQGCGVLLSGESLYFSKVLF